MLNSLSNATIAFVQQHPDLPVANTTETLATIVYVRLVGKSESFTKTSRKCPVSEFGLGPFFR